MKLIKNVICIAALAGLAINASAAPVTTVKAETVEALVSNPVVEAVQKDDKTVLVSPRTGMRYSVNNPNNIPIIFRTEVIAAATSANADRIVATNPALSAESQQEAKQALIQLAGSAQ